MFVNVEGAAQAFGSQKSNSTKTNPISAGFFKELRDKMLSLMKDLGDDSEVTVAGVKYEGPAAQIAVAWQLSEYNNISTSFFNYFSKETEFFNAVSRLLTGS